MAPYRLALVGLHGVALVIRRVYMAQGFVLLAQSPFSTRPCYAQLPPQLLQGACGKMPMRHGRDGASLGSKELTRCKESSLLWPAPERSPRSSA